MNHLYGTFNLILMSVLGAFYLYVSITFLDYPNNENNSGRTGIPEVKKINLVMGFPRY